VTPASLVRLVIVAAEGERSVEADVPIGERLIDVCDELQAPILFSCRTASCGVCRVHVREGAKTFTHPTADETEVLEIFEASPGERLACQLVIHYAAGPVRLVAVEPLPKPDDNP
jgi:ferredoxin